MEHDKLDSFHPISRFFHLQFERSEMKQVFNSIFKTSWVNKKSLKYLNNESMKGKPNRNICLASLLSVFAYKFTNL